MHVARCCAAKVMAQWVQAHNAAGGQDPSFLKRSDLIGKGVPLKAAAGAKKKIPSKVRAKLLFANAAWAQRPSEQLESRTAYLDFMRTKCAEVDDLPELDQGQWAAECQLKAAVGTVPVPDGECSAVGRDLSESRARVPGRQHSNNT